MRNNRGKTGNDCYGNRVMPWRLFKW